MFHNKEDEEEEENVFSEIIHTSTAHRPDIQTKCFKHLNSLSVSRLLLWKHSVSTDPVTPHSPGLTPHSPEKSSLQTRTCGISPEGGATGISYI